ncbi:hypothetical protein HYS72_03300 [Candidatus Pacearchaeota archaeon]|nr:hypothetical protein [Candidatus Pacearchaeota archaeon]MBI2056882.1 hypothetical protein [Candidatus Pacearchaeota archaeon]
MKKEETYYKRITSSEERRNYRGPRVVETSFSKNGFVHLAVQKTIEVDVVIKSIERFIPKFSD